ncbi:17772_t:CDS:2, partial [Racocetra fulgida]
MSSAPNVNPQRQISQTINGISDNPNWYYSAQNNVGHTNPMLSNGQFATQDLNTDAMFSRQQMTMLTSAQGRDMQQRPVHTIQSQPNDHNSVTQQNLQGCWLLPQPFYFTPPIESSINNTLQSELPSPTFNSIPTEPRISIGQTPQFGQQSLMEIADGLKKKLDKSLTLLNESSDQATWRKKQRILHNGVEQYQGVDRPVDVSRYMTAGWNTIMINQCGCVWCIRNSNASIVIRTSKMAKVKQSRSGGSNGSHDIMHTSHTTISENFQSNLGHTITTIDDDDDEVTAYKMTVSLKCPLSMVRIKEPAKGLYCVHIGDDNDAESSDDENSNVKRRDNTNSLPKQSENPPALESLALVASAQMHLPQPSEPSSHIVPQMHIPLLMDPLPSPDANNDATTNNELKAHCRTQEANPSTSTPPNDEDPLNDEDPPNDDDPPNDNDRWEEYEEAPIAIDGNHTPAGTFKPNVTVVRKNFKNDAIKSNTVAPKATETPAAAAADKTSRFLAIKDANSLSALKLNLEAYYEMLTN